MSSNKSDPDPLSDLTKPLTDSERLEAEEIHRQNQEIFENFRSHRNKLFDHIPVYLLVGHGTGMLAVVQLFNRQTTSLNFLISLSFISFAIGISAVVVSLLFRVSRENDTLSLMRGSERFSAGVIKRDAKEQLAGAKIIHSATAKIIPIYNTFNFPFHLLTASAIFFLLGLWLGTFSFII